MILPALALLRSSSVIGMFLTVRLHVSSTRLSISSLLLSEALARSSSKVFLTPESAALFRLEIMP